MKKDNTKDRPKVVGYRWETPRGFVIHTKRQLAKAFADGHLPGKKEGKLLRKLMSQTGMTEEQLREHKKYRTMLSSTQKNNVHSGFYYGRTKSIKRRIRSIRSEVSKEMKKHPLHPDVVDETIARFRDNSMLNWYYWWPEKITRQQVMDA